MEEKFREFTVIDGIHVDCNIAGAKAKYNFRGLKPGQCFRSGLQNRPYLRARAGIMGTALEAKFSVLTGGGYVYVCRRS